MTSKSEKDRAKQIQDRCQNILMQMLKDEDNKYCVDCDAKGPRWASWNLGIFLCIRCAGIHRNLGVHISKVKSVNLDSWTPEQVVSLQQMGNSRARAVYEANLPDSFRRPQNDSSLEAFIRAKYEHKKYIAKEWVPPPQPKVNWDKEIDEEMEKQKRKKKSTSSGLGPLPAPTSSDKKYNKSDVIPSIPKPKSSVSPKLGRNTPERNQEAKISNGAADLLGLDTSKSETKPNDDIFSSFFSAPQEPTEPPKEIKPDLKAEEENFFKQPAPSEKEKSRLTKDSILALYSQTPSTNLVNQFNSVQPVSNQFNAVQPGSNQFNAVQTGSNQFNAVQPGSNQFNAVQPGSNQFNAVQPGSNQFNTVQPGSNQFNSVQPGSNQFSVVQPGSNQFNQVQTGSNQYPVQQGSYPFGVYQTPGYNAMQQQNGMVSQFNQFQGVNGQFQQPFGPLQQPLQGQAFAQNNQQFFNPSQQSQQLPQQFGSLNLGQSFPNSFSQPNANVASNTTWQ